MVNKELVPLSPELQTIQQRWLQLARSQQDMLYAQEFAPAFAPLFAKLPLHGAIALQRPRALISVLGFSWQPVALMAAWSRPERMLVLGTDESLKITVEGEGVLSLVARIAGVSRDVIEPFYVGDPGEEDIYRAVRNFLQSSGIPPRQVFVDPTGGKKSMSAAAALAGFLAGAPLVYVDYGQYHGPNRIPVAGTEYPRLLRNPLEVLGDLELRDVFAAFNRSDFQEAKRIATRLAERLYEPREAQCLVKLASAYGAWDRFDFSRACQELAAAQEIIDRFSEQGNWGWASSAQPSLEGNLRALTALKSTERQPTSIEGGAPLLVWYLLAARRFLRAGKVSLALLLTYALVERYVDLCLWVDHRLDDENPDYSIVLDKLDRGLYDKAGKLLIEKYRPRELDGPLMFSNGSQLLSALAPTRLPLDDLPILRGLSADRNKCEYEHGFLPRTPTKETVEKYLGKASEIVERSCHGRENLESLSSDYTFPTLR